MNQPPTLPDAVSEYFDNRDTDVQVETERPPGAGDPEPWDPEKIRIHTKHYSLRQVVDMVAERDLDLAPDFQRQYVWKDWQKCGLIESLLLGIPLPSFYFNEESDGRMQVVDGVQRLTTIFTFVHDKGFALRGLTYLHDLEERKFDELDGVFRRRLLGAQFVAHVIDPQTPYRVKFDIFRRLNTGGSPLSAQEIRHCMSRERSRAFLKKLAEAPQFADAAGSLVKHPRMADREVALRFVAYCLHNVSEYRGFGSLDEFLGRVTNELDDPVRIPDGTLRELESRFSRGMRNAKSVFGEHAFRWWPLGIERKNPVNRALFESWGVVLSQYPEERVLARASDLVTQARERMSTDTEFVNSISGSTSDVRSVETRFERVGSLVAGLLGEPQ